MAKTLSIIFLIVTCISGCNDNSSNQTLFRQGTPCDSTHVTFNQNDERIFYCYKDGTESFLITDKNEDTVYLKRFINNLFFEKLQFKNKNLTYASLNMLIRKPNGEEFSNNVLKFKIASSQLDKDSSFFYEIKESEDSILFRPNTDYDYQNRVDSIWVSGWEDYFPVYYQISDISYPSKTNDDRQFHLALRSNLNDSVKTILIHFDAKFDTTNGVAIETRYFDQTIYEWNQEIMQRINKNYTQQGL